MRKLLAMILVLMIMGVSAGCAKTNLSESGVVSLGPAFSSKTQAVSPATSSTEPVAFDSVTMTLEEGTLTSGGATFEVTNATQKKATFGTYYFIQKKTSDNQWIPVDYILDKNSVGWESIAYLIGGDSSGTKEFKISWEWLYGKLAKGNYRLVKNYYFEDYSTTYSVWTEFEIK